MTAWIDDNAQIGLIDKDLNPPTTIAVGDPHGFELGWDHAHYRVALPMAQLLAAPSLASGFRAGQAAFGTRTLIATPQVRCWLALRLHAWLHGRSVEPMEVTPHYLKQLAVDHCPITRERLAGLDAPDATIDRVRADAGYAAGNLALMSQRAHRAKAAHGRREALRFAQRIDNAALSGASSDASSNAHGDGNSDRNSDTVHALTEIDGLGAAEWARVAVLCSFVEALPHDQACELPLLVLPPNRLRLFNPVQALQAFVSRQLLTPGWSQRVNRFESLLASAALKRDFKRFFMTLLPRVLERAARDTTGRSADDGDAGARWALEDAWRTPAVQQHWAAFARQLDATTCESLLCRAASEQLTRCTVLPFNTARAVEGWSLATRGYVTQPARRSSRASPERASHRPASVEASMQLHQPRLC